MPPSHESQDHKLPDWSLGSSTSRWYKLKTVNTFLSGQCDSSKLDGNEGQQGGCWSNESAW